MTSQRRIRRVAIAGVILGCLASTSAMAQVAAAPADPAVAPAEENTGEIVVTAQKRSERLVQVPVAVTAVTGDALANQQINDTNSLVRAIPSLSFQAGNNPGNNAFRIRGVGTSLFSQGVESAVAVVVDGVVAARQAQGFSDIADIERVEVLRGPQSTLFGKNATAGVINIVTAAPTRELSGRVEATVAEQDEYRVKGTISGPLGDTIRARVSGYYNSVGGHIFNAAKNTDTNGYESWGLRGKLLWEVSPALTLTVIGSHQINNADCCSRVPVSISTPAIQTLLGSNIVASPSNRTVSNDDASFFRQKTTIASVQADYDLGSATLTSITAFQHYRQDDQFEPDQLYTDPLRYVGTFAYSSWNKNNSTTGYNNWTEELRIGSNGNSDLTYVAGIFLSKLDLYRSLERRRLVCGSGTLGAACGVTPTSHSSGFDGTMTSDHASVFGQVDWRVSGGLHVIAGLREQYEKTTVTGRTYGPLSSADTLFPGTPIGSGTRQRSGYALTGKAGLRYEFNRNLQVYGTYTRGYKAFALDIDVTTDFANQTGIAPERVNAYELGAKWRADDGSVDLNAAIFRSDFTDLQVQSLINAGNGTFLTVLGNAGKSRSQGFELEANLRPADNFSVAASFTYVDATVDVSGQSCPLQLSTGLTAYSSNYPVNTCYQRTQTVNNVTTTSNAIIDVVGGQLPATPKYRVSISPRYEHALGDLVGSIQATLNYQSDTIFNLNQDPLLKQDGYAMVDLNLGLRDADSRYSLTVFVRNLFNQTYYSQLNHGTILANAANPLDLWANINKDANRYFGATVAAKF
jgi:iron complex outermembrane receptor protein